MMEEQERREGPGEGLGNSPTEYAKQYQSPVRYVPEGENINKIRDILFGSQMREYEKRFSRVEERLLKELSNLRDEVKKRLDTLEAHVKNEVDSLNGLLKVEQDKRAQSVEEVTVELNNRTKALERRTEQLDEQAIRSQRELRQQLLDQSKNLNDEIRKKYEDLSALFEQVFQDMRTNKADRFALAALFTEMGMRLSKELHMPGTGDLGNG
jgi:hypothetical protein